MKLLARSLSLRAKMILMVAGTLIVAMSGTSVLIRGLVFDNIVKNKMKTVDILTLSLIHDVKAYLDTEGHDNPNDVIAKYMTYYRIMQRISYVDPNFVEIAASDSERVGSRSEDPPVVDAIKRAKPTIEVTRRDAKKLMIRSTSPILKGSRIVGAVDLEVSIEDIQLTLSAIDRRIFSILVVAVLASSITVLVLLRKTVLQRLARLISVTQEIAAGHYDIRVEEGTTDELGELAGAFNRMTADLQASAIKIASYNKHLEETVHEATQQLQQAYEDLKNAQSQLIMNEKMASLGVLIAGVAHEINTPVGSILNVARHMKKKIALMPAALEALEEDRGVPKAALRACLEEILRSSGAGRASATFAETRALERVLAERGVDDPAEKVNVLARLNLTEPEEVIKHVTILESPPAFALVELCGGIAQAAQISETSSQRIMEIVRALKLYAYSDDAKVEPTQINESIRTALVILRNQLKDSVRIAAELAPDLPLIPCTSDIHQIWTNLLNNALDAIAEGGEDREGEIAIRSQRVGDKVMVTVTDNGTGIPEGIVEKVFDPFFTTKDIGKGTGLGLCIVSGIVRKHGGEVRVASQPGRTTFEIILPVTGCPEGVRSSGSSGTFTAADVGRRLELAAGNARGR